MDNQEKRLAIATEMLQNHDVLSPKLFDGDNVMLPIVREKLLMLAKLAEKRFVPFFPQTKVLDIILCGSICSYSYSPSSDCDLIIILDDIIPDNLAVTQQLLGDLTVFTSKTSCITEIYGHKTDIGFLNKSRASLFGTSNNLYGARNNYSVLNNCWNRKPFHQEYAFTAEELLQAYSLHEKKLQNFVDSLQKTENGFLTLDNCRQLEKYLRAFRIKAFEAKDVSDEHEYSLLYNIYRLFKHCGVYGKLRAYINKSRENAIGKEI